MRIRPPRSGTEWTVTGLAFGLAVVLGATGTYLAVGGVPRPTPSTVAIASPVPSIVAASSSVSPSVAPSPSVSPSAVPPNADPLLGTDGRLTLLLLGSDYRPAHPGNRTDAIMVVSLDPVTRKAAGFSIPRDTVNFPLSGGGVFRPKVNALYQSLQSKTGDGGVALSRAIADAFGIEIDGYVFIGFAGVRDLVGAVGGVDVTLDHAYYDPDYWVTSTHRGWGLPAGTSHLGPSDALIFARSRKGDNDFGRARRQQLLVLAALDKVRHLGIDKLPSLLAIARGTVRTNLPLDRAPDLFDMVATTNIGGVQRVVFGPRTYATGMGGTTFALNLKACRAWIAAHFPTVRPMAHWPPEAAPSSPPSASPAPAAH